MSDIKRDTGDTSQMTDYWISYMPEISILLTIIGKLGVYS